MIARRLIPVVALAVAGLGGFVASEATQAADRVKAPSGVERVHRFHPVGPSAEYEGDSGGIGVVNPLRFEVADEGARTAVLEISFRYRTRGPGPFVIRAGLEQVGGPDLTSLPNELGLPPAPEGDTAAVRFLVRDVAAGQRYDAEVGVNSVFPGRGTNRITTRKMLLTVELSD